MNGKKESLPKLVGVVGAGTMGSGIAQVAASAGFSVLLTDKRSAVLAKARQTMAESLERIARKEVREEDWVETTLQRVETVPDSEALASADIVIEAVFEDRRIKTELLRKLDGMLGPKALLASNTSTIPITALAAATEHPQRFAGLHFFNPVPVMPLVEIIAGMATGPETIRRLREFAATLGKETVSCRDRPGFIANRLLLPMINEAIGLLDEGTASAGDIDKTMVLGASHPMGPLALADLVGLDVVLHALEAMYEELGEGRYRPASLLRRMVETGRLGRKSGRGFHDY